MRVATAGFKDLPKIYSLELRSYEYPLEHNALQQILEIQGSVPLVGTIAGVGIGWALGQCRPEDKALEVARLAVHPSYRMQGRGRQLVGHLWNEAVKRQYTSIYFMVPEYQLDNTDPDSVLGFMDKLQFRAVGVETDFFWRYGRPYDGIKMERAT